MNMNCVIYTQHRPDPEPCVLEIIPSPDIWPAISISSPPRHSLTVNELLANGIQINSYRSCIISDSMVSQIL